MGYRIDLTGKKFGKLEVISFDYVRNKWKCLCDCQIGKIIPQYTYVKTKYLNNGDTKSCGCLHKEKVSIDITNRRFGKLLAISLHHRDKDGRAYWLCRCDCGNEVVVPVKSLTLTKGGRTSCGDCLSREMIGKKYGKLTVVEFIYTKNRKNYWKCKCECGNETYVSTSSLNTGNTTSCGCKHYEYEDLKNKLFGYLEPVEYMKANKWRCICHNCGRDDIIMRGGDIKHNRSCGCNNIALNGSQLENEIRDFIYTIVPKKDVILHERTQLKRKELDIYIPPLNLGIEYNGSAFHASENSPFRNHDKYYHRDKFLEARKQGINLITIFDKDYEEDKEKLLNILRQVISNSFLFFIPHNDIEYTNNDYGSGDWIRKYGYEEICQEEPKSFMYQDRFLVYRCGRTIWQKEGVDWQQV